MESGPCIDKVRLLDWILTHPKWRTLAFRYLRLRFSPDILLNALNAEVELKERGRLFSLGISHINIRDTYKTTGSNRTVLADKTILDAARHTGPLSLLEIGVSDGSSALNLLKEKKAFTSITLSDRYNIFYRKSFPFGTIFLDSDRKLLGFKLFGFYFNIASDSIKGTSGYDLIETINPLVAAESGIKSITRFDIFNEALDTRVDVIKCANILNNSYFSDEQLVGIMDNLQRSLDDRGRLVVSQNNDKYEQGEAVAVFEKQGGSYRLVENINNHDLIRIWERGAS